jgi:hypothetical protein
MAADQSRSPSARVLHRTCWCYTRTVPTTRPRLTITETDDVAGALDDAARRWPEIQSRTQLLLRLVETGRAALRRDRGEESDRRRDAIRRTSGSLTGAYDDDYLQRLRDDWPA